MGNTLLWQSSECGDSLTLCLLAEFEEFFPFAFYLGSLMESIFNFIMLVISVILCFFLLVVLETELRVSWAGALALRYTPQLSLSL